jgi:hypothetical protein
MQSLLALVAVVVVVQLEPQVVKVEVQAELVENLLN